MTKLFLVLALLTPTVSNAINFDVSSGFAIAIDSVDKKPALYEGLLSISAKTDNNCYEAIVDIDSRPILGRGMVEARVREQVVQAIEGQIRLGLSQRTGISPENIVIPPAMLENAINNFQHPLVPGVVGVDNFVANRISDEAVIEGAIRQAGVRINFIGCNKDNKGLISVEIGKLDPVHFKTYSPFHPHVSGPLIRVAVNLGSVTLYTEVKNGRHGALDNSEGDAVGYVAELVSRSDGKILQYDIDSEEAGAILESPVGKVIAAIGNRKNSSYYALVDFTPKPELVGGFDICIQATAERTYKGTETGTVFRNDLIIAKKLKERLTLWAEIYTRRGTDQQKKMKMDFFATGAEYRVAKFKKKGEVILSGDVFRVKVPDQRATNGVQGVIKINWGSPN